MEIATNGNSTAHADEIATIDGRAPQTAALAAAAAQAVPNNGDEASITGADGQLNFIANYHKGLPHNEYGEVDPVAYAQLLTAVTSRRPADFERIALGMGRFGRKLTSPQAGLATDVEGPLPASLTMPPPPRLESAEAAAEAAELYWMALLRDVPFSDFERHPLARRAAADLSELQAVQAAHKATAGQAGPRHTPAGVIDQHGRITPQTLFRGFTPGDLAGPYLSQFLLLEIPYGSLSISQRQRTVLPGNDYLTAFEGWRAVQNGFGNALIGSDAFDPTPRYIRSPRDLGQYVHVDALYEAYLNACLILLGMDAPTDAGNPYNSSKNQAGFATFGGPHILSLVTEVATRALKAIWYQKWVAHRRQRPEAYGGLLHLRLAGLNGARRPYALHGDILRSEAVHLTHSLHGSYLLPMAFPEGSPLHPAYGSGHATVAGACVTVLKAWFDEDYVIPNPVVPNRDGTALEPYSGPDAHSLTVRGELDKVAANIGIGRNMAGVHWRSDYSEAVKLGETVAICILKQQSGDYNERSGPASDRHPSFSLTRFDGSRVTISNGKVTDASGRELEEFRACGATSRPLTPGAGSNN